jgi:hypothetical protein
LTPLKQSTKETPAIDAFSISLVCCIMATCFLASSSVKPEARVDSRVNDLSASSILPFLTNHQGLSGAKAMPVQRQGRLSVGNIH